MFTKAKDLMFIIIQKETYVRMLLSLTSSNVHQCFHRQHKKGTQFKFKNISMVPAVVYFSLDNENYDSFDISPREIEIKVYFLF